MHVVRDDHDRIVPLQLVHQLLDPKCGDRVERGCRLVHEQHVGARSDRPRHAQSLLLSARERVCAGIELVLDLIPERGPVERLLDEAVHVTLEATDLRSERDVVVDRLGERVRCLKHNSDVPAHFDWVDLGAVEVDTVIRDLPFYAGCLDEVVHPVDGSQNRGLPAARGSNERSDLVLAYRETDIVHGLEVAVVHTHIGQSQDHHVRDVTRCRLPSRPAWSAVLTARVGASR